MGQSHVVDVSVLRQCHTGQVTGDPEALLTAHKAELARVMHLVSFDLAVDLGREKTFAVLSRENGVLSYIRERMIADATSIDGAYSIPDLVRWELLELLFRLSRLAQHISLFWHFTQAMSPHDIGVSDLMLFLHIWNGADVLVEEAILDTGLDLWNDCASVHIEVLRRALSDPVLNR